MANHNSVEDIQKLLNAFLRLSESNADGSVNMKNFGVGNKPDDIIEIDVRELGKSGDGWHVRVECRDSSWDVCLRELPSSTMVDELRWSIETYAQEDPYNFSRCEKSAREIDQYSTALFSELQFPVKLPFILSGRKVSRVHLFITQNEDLSQYHQLQWELLESPALWGSVSSEPMQVSVTRSYTVPTPFSIRVYEEFKLVYVMARPKVKREKYIDHRLLLRSLVGMIDEIHRMAINVRLFVVRPGSWEALVEYLDTIRAKHGKGSVSLVHLDMHGRMRKETNGNTSYYLDFVHHSTGRRNSVPAFKLAKLLQQHGIRNAVINACESANPRVDSANLAKVLIQHGLSNVLAMSFKLATTAAEIFFNTFYKSFLEAAPNFPKAASDGRAALLATPLRRANFGLRVPVHDWMVPVLYTNRGDESITTIRTRAGHLRHYNSAGYTSDPRMFLSPDAAKYEVERINKPPLIDYDNPYWASGALNPDFIGRDWEIMQLENKLSGKPNAVLHLYGPAGSGKTAMAGELLTWWARTGFVTRQLRLFSCRSGTLDEEINKLLAGQYRFSTTSGEIETFTYDSHQPVRDGVIFIDDLDYIDEILEKQDDCDILDTVSQALAAFATPTTRFVLISRQAQPSFRNTHGNQYLSLLLQNAEKMEMRGLSEADAAEFGAHVMTKKGEDMNKLDIQNVKSLERLYEELAYLPGTIESFLQHCSFIGKGLHPQAMSNKRQLSQPLGVMVLIRSLEAIQEVYETIQNDVMITSLFLAPFDLYLPAKSQLIGYLLWPAQHEELFTDIILQMKANPTILAAYRTQIDPDAQVDGEGADPFFKWAVGTIFTWMLDFISRCTIRGLMFEDQTGKSGSRIWIHPELTSFLRSFVREKVLPKVQSSISRTFANFMSTHLQTLAYYGAQFEEREPRQAWSVDDIHESIKVESLNYLQAVRLGTTCVGSKVDNAVVVTYKDFWSLNHEIFEALKSSHTLYRFEQWVELIIPMIQCFLDVLQQLDTDRIRPDGQDLVFPLWVVRAIWNTTHMRRGADACKNLNIVIKKILEQTQGVGLPPSAQESRQWMVETVGEVQKSQSKILSQRDRDSCFQLAFSDAVVRLRYASEYRTTGNENISGMFTEILQIWHDYATSGKINIAIAPWTTKVLERDLSELSTPSELDTYALAFGLALDHENDAEQGEQCFEIQKLLLLGNIQQARILINDGLQRAMLQDNIYGEYDFRRYMLELIEHDQEANLSKPMADLVAICERIGRDASPWCTCQRIQRKANRAMRKGAHIESVMWTLQALRSSALDCKNIAHQRKIVQDAANLAGISAQILCYLDLCLSVYDNIEQAPFDLVGTLQWCMTVMKLSDAEISACRGGLIYQVNETEDFAALQDISGRSGLEMIKAIVLIRILVNEKASEVEPDNSVDLTAELSILQEAAKSALFGRKMPQTIDGWSSSTPHIYTDLVAQFATTQSDESGPPRPYFGINEDGYIQWLDNQLRKIRSPDEQSIQPNKVNHGGQDIEREPTANEETTESDLKVNVHYGLHAETNELMMFLEVGEQWVMLDTATLADDIITDEDDADKIAEQKDNGTRVRSTGQEPGAPFVPSRAVASAANMTGLSLTATGIQMVSAETLMVSDAERIGLRRTVTF